MRKSAVKVASTLFPNAVVSFAYRQLTNPQVKKLRANEMATLDKSERSTLKFHDFDIQLYTWQGGEDAILLIHGWQGQAGNFADLIERLIALNYTVYAFDGPSHGFSSKGKSSLFEFAELVELLIRKFNAKKLISHSFGGVATTYALFSGKEDLAIDTYVLLTTPDKFTERIDDVAKAVGITEKVKHKLIQQLEVETQQNVAELNVSDFVKHIQVNRACIIHDKNDKVIPISRSRNVHRNWKNATFIEVEGTGHFRILRTEAVLDKVIHFLNQSN